MKIKFLFIVIFFILSCVSCSNDHNKMENVNLNPYSEEVAAIIGRGLVALPMERNRIFLSWRLLPSDREVTSFNIFRENIGEITKEPDLIAQTDRTFYIDQNTKENHKYSYLIRADYDDKIGEISQKATVTAREKGQNSLVIDVGQDYKQARVVTGDLNGDGELEIVVQVSNSKILDPYQKLKKLHESTDTIKVKAFLRTGECLWTLDLGWGIEAGRVYSPLIVWDIDADGRSEVILKTNKSENPLDYDGERLTIVDGETGQIINEAKWPSAEGLLGSESADNATRNTYNNNSRNKLAIAHLDGKNPYIIAVRGCYLAQRIVAYDSKLNIAWERVLGKDILNPIKNKWLKKFRLHKIWRLLFKDSYRGSHSLPIADINNDGREEILWGERCIGEGGKDIWKIEDRMPYNGHPDIVFPADIIPSIKGKEIFYCREGWREKKDEKIGMFLVDNQGKTIWAHWGYTHVDWGWVAKLLQNQDGMQCYGFDLAKKIWTEKNVEYSNPTHFLWGSDGKLIDNPPNSWIYSFTFDWDGDGVDEIIVNGGVQKYNGPIIARFGKGKALLGADLFGDHREELVFATWDGKIHIFFNTQAIKSRPKITLLADRQYKNDLSH